MARCVKCRKWGFFLKTDANGMCKKCLREEYVRKRNELATETLKNIPMVEIAISHEKTKSRALYELEVIKFSNITPKGKYPEFVVVDVETTGLKASRDRIVEIAAVRFVDNKPTEMFSTLINPEISIPKDASDVNGITNEMVKDSPTIQQTIKAFDVFVGGSDIVAHNLSFDLGFIHKSGSSITDTKRRYFCTLEQGQKLLKKLKRRWNKEYEFYEEDYESDYDVEDHKLGTLCEYFDIVNPSQHRAYADAYCTGLLFLEMINMKQSASPLRDIS